jgi:DNA polymerase III alpha subunit
MESMADTIPVAATGTKSTSTHHAFIRALLLAQEAAGYVSLCEVISQAKTPNYENITCPVLFLAGLEDKTSAMNTIKTIHDS